MSPNTINVFIESGKKRTIANAVEWPGWSRGGRDEESALQALCDYGTRFVEVLHAAHIEFMPPADVSAFVVTERHEGTSTTDYGVPDITSASDLRPIDEAELQRLQALLTAYWQAFDVAVQRATGKELRKGPRGGGRELDGIVEHVLGAEANYIRRLAWTFKPGQGVDLQEELALTRQAALDALAAAAQGELPEHGPRGGAIWKPRYFVRRAGWHVLDHLWEIEDRVL